MLNYRVVIAAFLALFLVTPIVASADLKKLPTPSGNFADLKINSEDFYAWTRGRQGRACRVCVFDLPALCVFPHRSAA